MRREPSGPSRPNERERALFPFLFEKRRAMAAWGGLWHVRAGRGRPPRAPAGLRVVPQFEKRGLTGPRRLWCFRLIRGLYTGIINLT